MHGPKNKTSKELTSRADYFFTGWYSFS